jgi:hypothetical protein
VALRGEMSGDSNKLCNDKLYDFFSSPNILQVIKSRTMRWTRHVARVGEKSVQDLGGET